VRSGSNGRRWRRSYHGRLQARCLGGCVFRGLFGHGFLLGRGFLFSSVPEVLAHSLGCVDVDRTRMRFFLGNAGLRQIINNCLGLDLEFARQFVDADLIRFCHCPPGLLLATFFRLFLGFRGIA
jgi:hypothetical protein